MDRYVVSPSTTKRVRRSTRVPNNTELALWNHRRCFEATDSTVTTLPANFLLRGQPSRDPSSQTGRLADQFVELNRHIFSTLDLSVEPRYRDSRVELDFHAGTRIGAIPLLSPTSGRYDYGLVVRPRFDWPGIGPLLGATGWKVIPQTLTLPMLPTSEKRIPPWVLSTITLFRLKGLIDQTQRRFDMVNQILPTPRGSIDWAKYAHHQIGRAKLLEVPCRFPELQNDRDLRAAIRFALDKQLRSLESQRLAGTFVIQLIELCRDLIDQVRDVAPREPSQTALLSWRSTKLKTEPFLRGVEAIEWTVEERGLAGLSDLQGLPWSMSMEEFFEAWVETVASLVSQRIGGSIKSGRERQTVVPLFWDPPYRGSQKALIPDLVIERGDTTVIIDAKYKDHWEELQQNRWKDWESELRERHRNDLLQVLAYSTVVQTPKVLICLVYPCHEDRWLSLRDRNLLIHRASLPSANRRVELVLMAFPLSTSILQEAVEVVSSEVHRVSM